MCYIEKTCEETLVQASIGVVVHEEWGFESASPGVKQREWLRVWADQSSFDHVFGSSTTTLSNHRDLLIPTLSIDLLQLQVTKRALDAEPRATSFGGSSFPWTSIPRRRLKSSGASWPFSSSKSRVAGIYMGAVCAVVGIVVAVFLVERCPDSSVVSR